MAKYLFVYHGGSHPETEAEVAAVMDAWGSWLGGMGSAVVDGGNPVVKAPHRDRLMRLKAPFNTEPEEVFKAKFRIQTWRLAWGANDGMLMLTQRERIKRWRYVWLLDVDKGTSRLWYDLDELQ